VGTGGTSITKGGTKVCEWTILLKYEYERNVTGGKTHYRDLLGLGETFPFSLIMIN